jgi:hypothetical protein
MLLLSEDDLAEYSSDSSDKRDTFFRLKRFRSVNTIVQTIHAAVVAAVLQWQRADWTTTTIAATTKLDLRTFGIPFVHLALLY